jgi:hypothetical protein
MQVEPPEVSPHFVWKQKLQGFISNEVRRG